MIVKKAGGKVYGAALTAAEKKAMDIEIKKQLIEMDKKFTNDLDATILYYLHVRYGFGFKRLKDFYMGFGKFHKELIEYYQMEDSDDAWLCTHNLKDLGVDLEEWSKERGD